MAQPSLKKNHFKSDGDNLVQWEVLVTKSSMLNTMKYQHNYIDIIFEGVSQTTQ